MVPVLSIKYDAVNMRSATLEVITAVEQDFRPSGTLLCLLAPLEPREKGFAVRRNADNGVKSQKT